MDWELRGERELAPASFILENQMLEKFYDELKKYDLSRDLSPTAINNLKTLLKQELNKVVAKLRREWHFSNTSKLTKSYRSYKKTGFQKHNAIKSWKLNEVAPSFRKALKRQIKKSAGLIQSLPEEVVNAIVQRLLGALSGGHTSPAKLKEALRITKEFSKANKHVKFVIKDQTKKMISSFDKICAQHFDAIGFEWQTMEDSRVAGDPMGLYPKADDSSKMHGDHYSRNGNFYFYNLPNKWSKAGLLNLGKIRKEKAYAAAIPDGLPGEPIACRCVQHIIYSLEDVPEDYLSDKAKEYLKNKAAKLGSKGLYI